MTTEELNNDIKKLSLRYKKWLGTSDAWGEQKDMYIELERLYMADPMAEYISHISLKRMISLNHALRAVPFHQFYLINLD